MVSSRLPDGQFWHLITGRRVAQQCYQKLQPRA